MITNYERYDITDNPEWNICFNLMLRDDVSEIQAVGPGRFFYKSKGKRIPVEKIQPHDDVERYVAGIRDGLAPFVHSPHEFGPEDYLFEGPLKFESDDGKKVQARCHIVTFPASEYPQITIAKRDSSLLTLEKIAEAGSMSAEMLLFILAAVKADLTICLSGGTGAGKTTMLEAITKLFPNTMRIGVAEDTPELNLVQPNVAYLHSVPWRPGSDPNNVATLSWVVQQFQRMRTDKIIIGETRGKEFADFLIAANSGMDGSMTTLHANDPVQCLEKMTSFALKAASNVPIRTVNNDIATAVDLVIQLAYLPSGAHRMTHIQEITNTLSNDDQARITTNALYTYDRLTDTWQKENPMTDALRARFAAKNVDITPFLQSPLKVPVGPYTGGIEEFAEGTPSDEERDLPVQENIRRSKGLPIQPNGERTL